MFLSRKDVILASHTDILAASTDRHSHLGIWQVLYNSCIFIFIFILQVSQYHSIICSYTSATVSVF